MGLIETPDDINIDVKGDVNNKWGKIRSAAKTYVRSKEGDIQVGAGSAQTPKVSAPYYNRPPWQGMNTYYANYKNVNNGSSITGGTHLVMDAKNLIDVRFGDLYLTGERLKKTEAQRPYLHLKAGLQILLEAGLINSSRPILFETPKFHSFMSAPVTYDHDHACMGKHHHAIMTRQYATSEQPRINSGGDITFKVENGILDSTLLNAAGFIKKVSQSGTVNICSKENPCELKLNSAQFLNVNYAAQDGNARRSYTACYPTTLLSGADISITDQVFRINGLVAVIATNIGIAVGSANIHGASGSIFSFAEAQHFFANEGVWTNNATPASSLPQGTFIPTGQLHSIIGSAQSPLIAGSAKRPSVIQQNVQTTYVPPVFSSSFFCSASLPRQAFTLLTVNGKPIELTESESLQNVGISTKSVNEARDLPALFSQSDWENLYDMAHSHTLHRTYAENSFTQTLKQAYAYSKNTGSIEFSAKDTFKKPFTAFVIVNKNGKRVLNAYTYTPKEYYNGKLLLTGSAIAAIGGNVQLEAESEFSAEKLAILAKQDIRIKSGTLMLKDVDTTAEGITQMFGRDFVGVLGGIHKAREFFAKSVGPVHIGESFDRKETHIDTKKHKEHTIDIKSLPASIIANYAHFESLGGQDITFVGTQIDVPQSKVITPGGRVHFKLGTNSYYSYRFEDDSNAMLTDKTTTVQQDKTYVECKINGIMDIEGATKVIVEKVDKRPDIKGINAAFLHSLLDETYGTSDAVPVPEFVQQLRGINPDMLEYILAKEVHDYTEHNISAPGAGLMAVVAVATAVCTMGTASAIAGSVGAAVGGGTMGAVVGASAGGAFSSLCVQTSMSLMQNGGDPLKAAKSLCNSDTLKQLGIAAVTAGVLKGCSIGMGFEASPPLTDAGSATKDVAQGLDATKVGVDTAAQAATSAERVLDFGECIQKHLAHSTLSTGVRAGFGEKIKDPIETIARGAAASAIGQWAAGKIGRAYADPKNPIDPASHKLYHAALGAATGSLMGGTGCAVSGAVGALVAELSADIMKPSKPLEQMKQKEHELGRKLKRAEFNVLYPSVHKNYMDDVKSTEKVSKIIAAISAAFAGGNVAVGAATGANAIDNNTHFVAGFGVSALADTAFAAYLAEGLTLVGGVYLAKEALDFIGVKAVDGGYSYNDRVYGSVNDVLTAVMVDNPVTQAAGSIYLVAKTLLDVVVDGPSILTTPIQEGKPSIVSTPAAKPEPTVLVTPENDEAGKYNVETFSVGDLPELDPEGFTPYDGPQETVLEKKIHVVYGKPGPGEEADYIGRTRGEVPDEGYSPEDVDAILRERDRNHHMNERGFGDARLRHVSENPAAVRGLEQQEIERQGGAKSQGGTSSNAINGIAAKNPKRDTYLDAAKKEFGES